MKSRTLVTILGIGLAISVWGNGFLGYQYFRLLNNYKTLYSQTERALDAAEGAARQNEKLLRVNQELLKQREASNSYKQ